MEGDSSRTETRRTETGRTETGRTETGRTADLTRTWAIVPVRGLESAKSRLGELLDAEERRDLVVKLLERTLLAAADTPAIERTLLVSPDPDALSLAARFGAETIAQPSSGLNAGLRQARDVAVARGATAILVIPADLPGVSTSALNEVLERGRSVAAGGNPTVVLVTDRHGSGTNALLVSPADAMAFEFGLGSRAAHRSAALAAGAAYDEIDGPLAFDVDTADDLLMAESTMQQAAEPEPTDAR